MRQSSLSRRLALGCTIFLVAGAVPLRGLEVIDRVVAIVSGNVITLSDARAAVRLGLVDTANAPEPLAVAVKALIERQLVLDEAVRSVAPDPSPDAVALRLAAIRSPFADRDAYARALADAGLDESTVNTWVRQDVQVREYLRQRFEAILPPSDDEVQADYAANPAAFTRDGARLPLDEVRPSIVARLVDARRRQAIDAWITRLRQRADVVELYLPRR
jgi:hypothetical protein